MAPCRGGTGTMTTDLLNTSFYSTLLDIWEKLNASLELEYILTNAMTYLEEVIGAERSSVWELDERRGELSFRVVRGEDREHVREIKLKLGEGVVGHTAATGEPVMIKDVEQSDLWSVRVDQKTHFHTRSILSVPLMFREKVVGVVQLINKRGENAFDAHDLQCARMMAIPIATALVNARLFRDLEQTFMETALALADAIEKRDRYTAGHTRRVTKYALMIADRIGISASERKWLALSGILHDIGKIGIRDKILNKDGPLAKEEFESMKTHTILGAEIVEKVSSLEKVIDGILYHHEKLDGTGYPHGLKGDEIPVFARIIAVADTYDAITTDRPYRKGMASEAAFQELERNRGTQFDPEIVDAFLAAMREKEHAG